MDYAHSFCQRIYLIAHLSHSKQQGLYNNKRTLRQYHLLSAPPPLILLDVAIRLIDLMVILQQYHRKHKTSSVGAGLGWKFGQGVQVL